jgi:DNA-binding NarL/FixJ family response regulator
MGVRRPQEEMLDRLASKTLDDQFRQIVREGLNCSAFEAEAVLDAVHEVYGPYMGACPQEPLPGRLTLVALDSDEPPGKPVARCAKRTVVVTVHKGAQDDLRIQQAGMEVWRRERLAEVCQEALSQGALLTREDLAYRVFFVSPRTISRDLAALRRERPERWVPLRSMVQDIGPMLTHRELIVRYALDGRTVTQICQATHHSPAAVANYLSTFTRCAQLSRQGVHPAQIAFLLRRGRSLVERYLALAETAAQDANRQDHLEALVLLGAGGQKKTRLEGRPR